MTTPAQAFDEPWSNEIPEPLQEFCRHHVYQAWLDTIRARNGEIQTNFVGPFLGIGPRIPAGLLPLLLRPAPLQLLLGRNLNMVTVILTPARNRIVFLAAERYDGETYREMIRLDDRLPTEFLDSFCRMIQVGHDERAFTAMTQELASQGLERFAPGMLKVADLEFFQSFFELWELRGNVPAPVYARAAFRVAHDVIQRKTLHFYPSVPLDRVLRALRYVLRKKTKG